jgi:hypothetical protein
MGTARLGRRTVLRLPAAPTWPTSSSSPRCYCRDVSYKGSNSLCRWWLRAVSLTASGTTSSSFTGNITERFRLIKPTKCTNFSNLFWNENLHVSDSSSVYHQELFTVHSAMVYVVQVCRQLSRRIRMELQFHPDPPRKLFTKLYDIHHCWMYSE